MLTTILLGCAREQASQTVVLDALAKPMCELAVGVVHDGGPESKRAARNVISIYDAGVLDRGPNRC